MTKTTPNNSTQNINTTEIAKHADTTFIDYPRDAEKVNGRWAMLGLIALFGAYASTGQIIPGIL